MNHICIICKDKFQLSKTEVEMIENGEISPLDVNICDECADRANEQWQLETDCMGNCFSDADPGL